MKTWVKVLLIVAAVLFLAAVGAVTAGYFMFYKPLLSANTYVGGARRLESIIANKSPYDPPGSGELTDDQVARFVTVEERVQRTVGSRIATFRTQYEVLTQTPDGPTSRTVRRAMGEIGGVYLQAKETQYRALNEASFSKAEYEWVRQQVYAAAGLPFTHLDLPEILADPGNLEEVIPIERAPAGAVAAGRNQHLVEPHAARLKDWLLLAFFDL
jgi:hypothetical protein